MSDKHTKIIEFHAENTRVLKLVRIKPDGNMVIIGGDNEAGKTTVLDDIELIFAGARSKKMPAVPIRAGETKASTSVKLSNGLMLTREWSAKGSELVVHGEDGKRIPGGPQGIADQFYSAVAFDPLEFADKMDSKKQAETLRKLVGLDFSQQDERRARLYAEREESGRELRQAQGHLASMQDAPDGTPDLEVSISKLLEEKATADRTNKAAEDLSEKADNASDACVGLANDIKRLKAELAEAEEAHAKAMACNAELFAKAKAAPRIDVSPIMAKLSTAEETNRNVRAKHAKAAKLAEVAAMEAERAKLTEQIEGIDEEKRTALAKVKWPVDGLGFNSDGVTYKGLPFEQASKAARYRVSIAIGALMNPELHVMLLRDASALDAKAMALLAELANERDEQLWIERVGAGDAGAIVLVDGEVRSQETASDD